MWGKFCRFYVILSICLLPNILFANDSEEINGSSLLTTTLASQDWGLKIVVLNVGQADAILLITPNGNTTLIDSGKYPSDGKKIAAYLKSQELNGVGDLKTINQVYSTHYDSDHIGGLPELLKYVDIHRAFDQGYSLARHHSKATKTYQSYLDAVGDSNDNLKQDPDENNYVRQAITYGHIEHMGASGRVEIKCLSVNGDTEGNAFDLDLDPSKKEIDENPGSIALLVRLGDFEFYSAGDQTDNDWKTYEPAAEENVLASGAITDGNDIDVLKVSHHGSDTSTSKALVAKLNPEVAIISSKYTGDEIPKKITLKTLQNNKTYTLITGDARNPVTRDYANAKTDEDNDFKASDKYIFNNQENVTILVSGDGAKYTVTGRTFDKTFDSVDSKNIR